MHARDRLVVIRCIRSGGIATRLLRPSALPFHTASHCGKQKGFVEELTPTEQLGPPSSWRWGPFRFASRPLGQYPTARNISRKSILTVASTKLRTLASVDFHEALQGRALVPAMTHKVPSAAVLSATWPCHRSPAPRAPTGDSVGSGSKPMGSNFGG